MGLDMHLEGHTFIWTNWEHPEKNQTLDGFKLKGHILELGYWRKHPNLHGFIVETFANGEDKCQEIELNSEAIVRIIEAIRGGKLPHTEGFFFGKSHPEDDEPSIRIFQKALNWLTTEDKTASKTVIYRASW